MLRTSAQLKADSQPDALKAAFLSKYIVSYTVHRPFKKLVTEFDS